MNRYAFGTSEGVWRLTAKEGRDACAVNKEGPIKAKPPLCPFFLLFGYQLARFTVSRPQTDLSLLASLPACPDLCSRLIVLAQFPTHDLSLSLFPPIEKITTPEILVFASTHLVFHLHRRLCIQPFRFRFLDALSSSPFSSSLFSRFCSQTVIAEYSSLVSIEQRNPNFIPYSNNFYSYPPSG